MKDKKKVIKVGIVILVMAVCGVFYSCSRGEDISLTSEVAAEDNSTEETSATEVESVSESKAILEAEETVLVENAVVYLHVCGAVVRPDVYELSSDARITDAVKAAGGFSEEADEDFLNLALPIADGMKIYVPTVKEVEEGYTESILDSSGIVSDERDHFPEGQASTSNKVNINTAGAEQLKTLSGIGDKRATDIISYRDSHGNFGSIEDIKNVPGIKEGVFEKIKEDIEV